MAHNHRDHEGAEKLYELIKDVKICMMTTVEPDGSLHSRPMYNMDADEAGDLWFFTKISSPKVTEISKDGQVNLAYAIRRSRITCRCPGAPRSCATAPGSTRSGARRRGPGSRTARTIRRLR